VPIKNGSGAVLTTWSKTLTIVGYSSLSEALIAANQSVQQYTGGGEFAVIVGEELLGKKGAEITEYSPEGKYRFIQEF